MKNLDDRFCVVVLYLPDPFSQIIVKRHKVAISKQQQLLSQQSTIKWSCVNKEVSLGVAPTRQRKSSRQAIH